MGKYGHPCAVDRWALRSGPPVTLTEPGALGKTFSMSGLSFFLEKGPWALGITERQGHEVIAPVCSPLPQLSGSSAEETPRKEHLPRGGEGFPPASGKPVKK